MADEPVGRPDVGRQAPDFLTVDQTADVLQIGRSTTYELVGRFVRSAGTDGIPAIVVGGQYRIPRARLEEYAGQPITWPPPPRTRTPRPHRTSRSDVGRSAESAPQPAAELADRRDAEAGRTVTPRDRIVDSQPTLPFAG
jgi:excisionase family DNA binding protein